MILSFFTLLEILSTRIDLPHSKQFTIPGSETYLDSFAKTIFLHLGQ